MELNELNKTNFFIKDYRRKISNLKMNKIFNQQLFEM